MSMSPRETPLDQVPSTSHGSGSAVAFVPHGGGTLPQPDAQDQGTGHSPDQKLEKAIHETFELSSDFTLEEIAALVGFVLHRGADLKLAHSNFSIHRDEEFLWVHGIPSENDGASRSPQGEPSRGH